MLRISKLTDYGTVVMMHLARSPEQAFSAADLAQRLGLALPITSKVLKALSRHALLTSRRGAHGGYTLSRPATAIAMADIIDALEGQPFGITECSAGAGLCEREIACQTRPNWQRINSVLRRALEDVSLADFMHPPGASPMPVIHPVQGPEIRLRAHP